jgi:transcriptional antiterminator NusG
MELQVVPSSSSASGDISIHEPHWFATYTYPRHEKAVADQLAQKGVEMFYPTISTVSQWKDRRVNLEIPLFSGYVFARICAIEKAKILSVRSVIKILSVRGAPVPVSDDEIDSVRLCIQRGAKLQNYSFPVVGDRVRVKRGVFEDLEGTVVRHNNGCKLIVSISLIQQSVALEISADLLERITTSPTAIYSRPTKCC